MTKLFPRERVIGIFRGFSPSGLEFHAELVLPYRNEFQHVPMHGQFLLVELEGENEGVLGRITSIGSHGRLVSDSGEEYGLRAVAEDRVIPEDLREQYLRYVVDMRVLGVLRLVGDRPVFVPSHRRLPHVGSKVAFLSDELLRHVVGGQTGGVDLGFFSLGEFIYGGDDERLERRDWMRVLATRAITRFDVRQLVSRRSFVFARAGFGKSNLNKLLFSSLYQTTPTVTKRGGRQVPVGTIIFDPEGEYFWPDDKGRPGLCDVPALQEQLVIFTNREPPSAYYGSFIAGGIKLDIRRLRPDVVLSIALSPERQEQQNVRKLKSLSDAEWHRLVDEIYRSGNRTDISVIRDIMGLEPAQEAEAIAARSNATAVVRMLHDPRSQMMDMLLEALRAGKLCILDVSQLRGPAGLSLSGLILRKIFDTNQEEFTKAEARTIPTIAVVEEAQTVLGHSGSVSDTPYVEWVKEGRKYDLGAVLITQQPGSISQEILSQGDNWFIFHLLSAGDLQAVKRANAHFSDDILSSLLNEPIPGNAVFWSSAGEMQYPVPVRVLSFEHMYEVVDPTFTRGAADTYAAWLRSKFREALARMVGDGRVGTREPMTHPDPAGVPTRVDLVGEIGDAEDEKDYLEVYLRHAFERVRANRQVMAWFRGRGVVWRGLGEEIAKALPTDVLSEEERDHLAFRNVRRFLDETFGTGAWRVEERPQQGDPAKTTPWIVVDGD